MREGAEVKVLLCVWVCACMSVEGSEAKPVEGRGLESERKRKGGEWRMVKGGRQNQAKWRDTA